MPRNGLEGRVLQKKNILFLAITVPVVILDQLTKAWILATLRLHEGFPVIDGFFNIVHVRNPGAAFGFLAGVSPVFRSVFFLSVTLAAIILILHYLRASRNDEPSLVISLALILAGAGGNLIDRDPFRGGGRFPRRLCRHPPLARLQCRRCGDHDRRVSPGAHPPREEGRNGQRERSGKNERPFPRREGPDLTTGRSV